MEKPIVFGVDVDGVLRDNLGIMVDLYNNRFDETMTVDDVHYFEVKRSFPKFEEYRINGRKWFFQEHADQIFLDAEPCKGAVSAMEILKQIGTVVIVTNQIGLQNKIRTLEWLEKYRIPYDSIFFSMDKHLLNCNIMVDDNVAFFMDSLASKAVVIEAPYNINVPDDSIIEDAPNIKQVLRHKSLYDFALSMECLI